MSRRRRLRARAPWAAACLALALAPAAGRAGGASASLEPGYSHEITETTDQTGRTSRTDRDLLTQNYRVGLDRDLFQNLTLSLGGSFLDSRAWLTTDGVASTSDDRTTSLFGRLSYFTPALSLGTGYDRRRQTSSLAGPPLQREVVGAYAGWRPLELPELELRFDRTHAYDDDHRLQDTTTNQLVLNLRQTLDRVELRYVFSWTNPVDELNGTRSNTLDHVLQATYNDTWFDGRSTAYLTATGEARSVSTTVSGAGGTIATQRFPVAGLSTIEALPTAPATDTLSPNPALIDGNVATGAGVDIGFAAGTPNEPSLRDLGAQFADQVTSVNTVYLWVDKALPPEVVRALAGSLSAWQSDDNVRWTPIALAQPALFAPFQARFEITLPDTQARYLKIVTGPLAAGVTTDRTFASIAVTELQFFSIVPASTVPRTQQTYSAGMNGTVRTTLLRSGPGLIHDVSLSLTRQTDPGLTIYTLVNGLTASQGLGRVFSVSSRVARQDQDGGRGHEGLWLWSSALTARPLPTAFSVLSYAGQWNVTAGSLTHALNLFSRADLYEGVSLQANLGGSVFSRDDDTTTSGQVSLNASVIPNRWVAFSATYLLSASVTRNPRLDDVTSTFERVDAAVSFTPAPSLTATVAVARVIQGPKPTTLVNLQLGYAPFRGDLQLGVSFGRSLDTAADATNQLAAATLRWNLRQGVFLNGAYSVLDNDAPVQRLRSRVLSTSLLILL